MKKAINKVEYYINQMKKFKESYKGKFQDLCWDDFIDEEWDGNEEDKDEDDEMTMDAIIIQLKEYRQFYDNCNYAERKFKELLEDLLTIQGEKGE